MNGPASFAQILANRFVTYAQALFNFNALEPFDVQLHDAVDNILRQSVAAASVVSVIPLRHVLPPEA